MYYTDEQLSEICNVIRNIKTNPSWTANDLFLTRPDELFQKPRDFSPLLTALHMELVKQEYEFNEVKWAVTVDGEEFLHTFKKLV